RDDGTAPHPGRALRPARHRRGGVMTQHTDVVIPGEPAASARVPNADHEGKGVIHVVHLYPREMSIYGDLGNTRTLAARIRRHGYTPVAHQHHPAGTFPAQR